MTTDWNLECSEGCSRVAKKTIQTIKEEIDDDETVDHFSYTKSGDGAVIEFKTSRPESDDDGDSFRAYIETGVVNERNNS